MKLSKAAGLVVIGLPVASVAAVLVVWYDTNTSPSFSEYIDSSKKTQEVQNFLTKYPAATAVERNYLGEDRLYPASSKLLAIEYWYFERPNVEENTARAVTLRLSFENDNLTPNYSSVSCCDQLREDSGVRIEGASLSNVTGFLQNENCPLNLRTSD